MAKIVVITGKEKHERAYNRLDLIHRLADACQTVRSCTGFQRVGGSSSGAENIEKVISESTIFSA